MLRQKMHSLKCTKIVDSWGFALDTNGEFTTFSKTYIAEFGWDRMWYVFIFGKFLDPPLRKDKLSLEKLNYTPDCAVSSMNFQNSLGRGSPSPLPRSLSPLNLGLRFRFGLRPQISGASRPRYGLHPQFTPDMFDHFPQTRELNKIFHPSTSTSLATPLCFITRYTDFHISLGDLGGLSPPIFQTTRRLW